MARTIHLMNDAERDATVVTEYVLERAPPVLGFPGKSIQARRMLSCTEAGLHESLREAHGEDYGSALIEGDPEVDVEQVGRAIENTDTVYLSRAGEVLYASPLRVDVITGPDGEERERRPAADVPANVATEDAVRWTGRRIPVGEAVRRFAFRRSLRVQHVDGLTYDFCYGMAKQLQEDGVVVLLGAGPKGKDPLVFRDNGKRYRAFLAGRVEGERYQLLLHLTDLELRLPEVSP